MDVAATRKLAANFTAVAARAAVLSGCAIGDNQATGPQEGAPGPKETAPAPGSAIRLIGDGSTAFTGGQPHLPKAKRLKAGQKLPQFVVFSWGGAGRTAGSCSRTSARSPGRTTRR